MVFDLVPFSPNELSSQILLRHAEVLMLTCHKCGAQKPATDFPPYHGYRRPCRTCINAASRERYAKNDHRRARHIAIVANQRAAKLGHPPVDIYVVERMLREATHCEYCGCAETEGNPFALEHRQPLARGGTQELSNLTVACQRCNLAKRTSTETEYRMWLRGIAERFSLSTAEAGA